MDTTNPRQLSIFLKRIKPAFFRATENFYIKYGELGKNPKAEDAYMKQKHR